MGEPVDCSTAIAMITLYRDGLQRIYPAGKWQLLPLWLMYQADRYTLESEDLETLASQLQAIYRQRVEALERRRGKSGA